MLKRLFALSALVVILLFLPLSLSSRLRDAALAVVGPLGHRLVHQNSLLVNFTQNIRQIPTLRQDKQSLQAQVVRLQQELAAKENLVRENELLRKELGITGPARESKKVFAKIILRGPDSALDHTFTVNVGSRDGVRVGQPATIEGFLIGRVISVRENTAIVRTILSKESGVQAWIASNREKGLLLGTGTTVLLTNISQGIEVPEKGVVETSGLGNTLPQGIMIGQIGEVQSKQSDTSQSFTVTLPHNPNNLDSLFILLTDSPL